MDIAQGMEVDIADLGVIPKIATTGLYASQSRH